MESSPADPVNPSPSKPEKIDSSNGGSGGCPADAVSDEADQDREYGCKYCQKKFSNKQALGGHQNAHKLERAMEKSAREAQENHFGYLGGAGLPYPGMPHAAPFLGLASYSRSHEYVNRVMYRPPYPSHPIPLQHHQHHHRIHFGFHNPRAAEPYMSRPVPGFDNVVVYPGTAGSSTVGPVVRNVGPFTGQAPSPSPYVQNQDLINRRVLTQGSRSRPVHQDTELARTNDHGFHQQTEDSGLDLSLKL